MFHQQGVDCGWQKETNINAKNYNVYTEKMCPMNTSNRKYHAQAKTGVKTVRTNCFLWRWGQ